MKQATLPRIAYTDKGAFLSDDKVFRYWLWRHWGKGTRRCLFIMLNPSTADGLKDDPTIGRVVQFANLWGFDGVEVVNMFAYRATDPDQLKTVADPVGPTNEFYVKWRASQCDKIICAWGSEGIKRQAVMRNWLKGFNLFALAINKTNAPGHPLYMPHLEPLKEFQLDRLTEPTE